MGSTFDVRISDNVMRTLEFRKASWRTLFSSVLRIRVVLEKIFFDGQNWTVVPVLSVFFIEPISFNFFVVTPSLNSIV